MDHIYIAHLRRSKTHFKEETAPRRQHEERSRLPRSRSLSEKQRVSSRSPSSGSNKRSHSSHSKGEGGKWEFERRKLVIKGSFGSTYLCRKRKDSADHDKFIDKQIKVKQLKAKQRNQLVKELDIVQMCSHANLKTPLAFVNYDGKLHVYMEFEQRGNLAGKIAERRTLQSPFEDDVVLSYLHQMINGVAYLHRHQIVHGNLKPTNVLVVENDVLKITDTGMACLVSTLSFALESKGMLAYLAPEVLKDQQCCKKSDTWSLGVIGYELAELCVPYRENRRSNLIAMISEGARQPLSSAVTPVLRDLIITMLHKILEKRPTCRELLKSPLFRKASGKNEKSTKQDPKEALSLPKEPANEYLVIVTCRWKKPVCTYWLETGKDSTCWRKGYDNVLVTGDGHNEQKSKLIVNEGSSVIPLSNGGAFLIDAVNQRAYRSFDVFSGQWHELQKGPRVRSSFTVGALKGETLYLIGSGPTLDDPNSVQTLDLEKEKWSRSQPLPEPTFLSAAVASPHGLVLFGSKSSPPDSHHRRSSSAHSVAIELDASGHWKVSNPIVKGEERHISGCEFREEIAVCLSSGVYFLKRKYPNHQLTYMGESPGNTESMTTWRNHLVMVRGQNVWFLHVDPKNGKLFDLPPLPFNEYYTRSFVLAVTVK